MNWYEKKLILIWSSFKFKHREASNNSSSDDLNTLNSKVSKNDIIKNVNDSKNKKAILYPATIKNTKKIYKFPKVITRNTLNIEYYGKSYDHTKKSTDYFRQRLTPTITRFRSREKKQNIRFMNLTLKELFTKGDPITLMKLVSPNRMNAKSSRNIKAPRNDIKNTFTTRKVDNSENTNKKEIVNSSEGKTLEEAISIKDIKRIIDIPNVFSNFANWNLEKMYKKIRNQYETKERANMDIKVSLSDINDKLIEKFCKIIPLEKFELVPELIAKTSFDDDKMEVEEVQINIENNKK